MQQPSKTGSGRDSDWVRDFGFHPYKESVILRYRFLPFFPGTTSSNFRATKRGSGNLMRLTYRCRCWGRHPLPNAYGGLASPLPWLDGLPDAPRIIYVHLCCNTMGATLKCDVWYHNDMGRFCATSFWPEDVSQDIRRDFTSDLNAYVGRIAPLYTHKYTVDSEGHDCHFFLSSHAFTSHTLKIRNTTIELTVEWGGSNWTRDDETGHVVETIPDY